MTTSMPSVADVSRAGVQAPGALPSQRADVVPAQIISVESSSAVPCQVTGASLPARIYASRPDQLSALRDLLTHVRPRGGEWERCTDALAESIGEGSQAGSLAEWLVIQLLDALSTSTYDVGHLAHTVMDVLAVESECRGRAVDLTILCAGMLSCPGSLSTAWFPRGIGPVQAVLL